MPFCFIVVNEIRKDSLIELNLMPVISASCLGNDGKLRVLNSRLELSVNNSYYVIRYFFDVFFGFFYLAH